MDTNIRNTSKALIINGNKILLTKCNDPDDGIYYTVPGGGQMQFETLKQAVKRECLEETGYSVEADRLAAVFEEITASEEFRRRYPGYAHKVFFVFLCHLTEEETVPVSHKDLDQLSFAWVDIGDIQTINFYPSILRDNLSQILDAESTVFLGEMYT